MWMASELGLPEFRTIWSAESRVNPTCGDKPDMTQKGLSGFNAGLRIYAERSSGVGTIRRGLMKKIRAL
jgi:hypothetical protein